MSNPFDQFDQATVAPTATAKAAPSANPFDQFDDSIAIAEPAPKRERTWGQALGDTAVQLAEGVNSIAGAVPSLVAPNSRTAEFFRDNADYWRDKQSEPLKGRIATADQAIDAAGQDGVMSQIAEAASQYFSDPALAARFVTTNLPSIIPGLGAAKLTQVAALARGASAARAASLATTAAGGANAVLNAGGARGEAFEDIKRTLQAQGYSPEQAEEMALSDSRVAAAVGALAGFVSGKTGLEGSLFGKATAQGALKAGTAATAAELAGEQIEEVAPKLTTNTLASQYDDRSIGKDVGRTIVETAIGSGPGSLVAGGAAAFNAGQTENAGNLGVRNSAQTPATNGGILKTEDTSSPKNYGQSDRQGFSDTEDTRSGKFFRLLDREGIPNSGDTSSPENLGLAGEPTKAATQSPQIRPEARLAELELLAESRGLTEAEAAEGLELTQRIQAPEVEGSFVFDDVPDFEQTAPQADPSQPVQPGTPAAAQQSQADAGIPTTGQPASDPATAKPFTNFWTFAKSKGYKPGQVQVGTELHAALKAEFQAQKASKVQPSGVLPTVPADGQQAAAPAVPAAVTQSGIDPSLQNRDRSRAASVAQMYDIARNPDYMRLGTSRTPDAGAPMVFAVGDYVDSVPQGNEGHSDVAVMSDGQRVPFRYAVLPAEKVQPSHMADGSVNPQFQSQFPGTLKALNNGRTAGLRAAYDQGTAERYRQELIADAAAHGVPAEVIQRTRNPILVRVYSEKSNTPDMAAKSQAQGLGMSPAELARQDAPLIDANTLAVFQPGDVTSAANRDFVRAFVGRLHQSGQDVGTLMTADGTLSPAGRQRIQAALMQAAYGDADLVGELFDSLDTDIKAIGEALKTVAGEWANMRDSARQGLINPENDITDNLIQAVNLIKKARRERSGLDDLTNQPDLMTGETPDPLTVGALRLFYKGRYLTLPVGRDSVIAMLRDYVRTAMATTAGADMFGQTVTPSDILNSITPTGAPYAQDTTQESSRGPNGSGDPVRSAGPARESDQGPGRDQTSGRTGQDSQGQRENSAGTDGRADPQTDQGDEAPGLSSQRDGYGEQEQAASEPTERETQAAIDRLKVGMVIRRKGMAASVDGVIEGIHLPTVEDDRFQVAIRWRDAGVPRPGRAAGSMAYISGLYLRGGQLFQQHVNNEPDTWEIRTSTVDSQPATRNEDVGQQLYANRRNFTGRGLTWDDVSTLNDTLKVKEVTKAKVWPRPNYEQLVADGTPPVLARMVKQVYDSISAGPTIRSGTPPTDAELKLYIDTLGKIREGLFGFVSDRQQVAEFARGVLTQVRGEPTALAPVSILDMSKTAMGAEQVASVLLHRVWPDELTKPTMGRFSRGSQAHKEVSIVGGNKALGGMQFTRTDISKWNADLGKGWPNKREAWEVQGYRILAPGEYVGVGQEMKDGTTRMSIRLKEGRGSWRANLTDQQMTNSFMLVQDGGFNAEPFPTREAATDAAREKVKRNAGAGQDIRGTNIENAERTGPARRQDGEVVTSQRLMDTFGFRGVNFGREGWINQAERQAYLNQAYDGLFDLADVLGVPPKAISLDGALGIAFGAQGKGKNAAHFVAGVNEINLTKTKGAGTLAHEWGHALDHHFANQAGLEKLAEPFLSEHASKPATTDRMVEEGGKWVSKKGIPTFGEGIRPEIVQAFRAIHQAMKKRNESIGEAKMRRDGALERAQKQLAGWIKAARRVIEGSNAENKADLLAEFDQHAEKLAEGDTGDGYQKAGNQLFSTRVAAVRNLIKDATGRVWSKDETDGLESNARYVKSLMGKQEADTEHVPQQVVTQYKRDSLAMDKEKGGKAYWGTSTEMFARAFELYVHDKLSQQGTLNTFLTDAERRASTPVTVADTSSAMARGTGSTRDLYLYPVGQERETLREAFDSLVDQIKTRETESGGVTLFNRKDGYSNGNDTDTQPSSERNQRDIADLESIVDDGNRAAIAAASARSARAVHPFRWVQVPGIHGLGPIAAAFGKRVVGFEVTASVLSKEFGFFNGVTRPGADGRIYLNKDADRPHLAVLGHELGHQLKRDRPDLYDQLVKAIRPYIKAKEYGTAFAKSAVARNSYGPNATAQQRDAAIREEFIGEVLSDGFMDRGFWQALGDRNPGLLKSVVLFVADLIATVKAAVGINPRTAKYLTDFDQVMQIAGEVMGQYGMESVVQAGQGVSAPKFNRNSLGTTPPQQPGPRQQNAWTAAKAKVMQLTSPEAITKLIYEFQDKLVDLKNLRDHIKALGGTITDLNDAYLGEELFHKRLAKRTEDFLDKEMKPLLAAMRANGVGMLEFERYLHARHAPEANKALAERNPNQAMIDAGKAKANKAVRDLELQLQRAKAQGSATKAIEESLAIAKDEAANWWGAQPHRGTEEERLALSGMSDAEAKAFMDSLTPRKAENLKALAEMVDQMQEKTLEALEGYGLMDTATLNAWRDGYQFYVPLHRDEAHADSARHPSGQGFSIKGAAAKSRVGSNEKVTNILAHIAMQRESALTRGEKNHVVKKLYLMAAQNPLEDFWQIDNPPMIKTIDGRTGFVRKMVDPQFKHLPNVVMVRIAGKDQAVVFNEHNPEAVRLAEAMKNLDVGDLHVVLGLAAKGTRWFASVNTQYNPIFGLINFARDVQAGLLNLSTTELAGQQQAVAAKILPAMRAIYRERRGKSANNQQLAKLWEEFQNVGGTTGYRDMFADAKDRANALTRELAALDRGEVSKAAHAVVDWLSDYNETMENSVRLASYQVALDQGMTKERAASLAKNLTVNFNRKGRQAREIGALYAFFNASIQGTARMVETLRGPVGKRIMYGGVLLGAVNALIGMAMMGGDDDDEADHWDQVPEFIKERSLVIPLGREDYLSIPMPLGFHVFPNIGRIAVEFALGDSDKSAGKQLGKLLMVMADAFNPLGGSQNLGQMVSPTVIDPVVALMQNRDWTGKPIYRENTSGLDPQPGHAMAKDSASTPSRLVAEAINRITGGTEYRPGAWSPTPDQLDYVIGQLTGGLGRELLKVNQTVASQFTGDDLPPYKIPLVGRLYGNTRGPSGQSERFYENVKLLNELENELQGWERKGRDTAELEKAEPLLDLVALANGTETQIRNLRRLRRSLVEDKDPGYQAEVKDIDAEIGQYMAELNNAVAKARKEHDDGGR